MFKCSSLLLTRELAHQVSTELFAFGKYSKVQTVVISGENRIHNKLEMVKHGAQVVVVTLVVSSIFSERKSLEHSYHNDCAGRS